MYHLGAYAGAPVRNAGLGFNMLDLLLHIDTYAEPTSSPAIEFAVRFASAIGCPLAGLATHVDIHVPDNWLAERLLNVSKLAGIEEAKSHDFATAALKRLASAADAAGVQHESIIARAPLHGIGPCVTRYARTRDICLLQVGDQMDSERSVAEDVIFGSGRAVLVFHPERAPLPTGPLKRVAIAWDHSRCSARAVAEAMPLLRKAQDVRIVTAVGEKAAATPGLGSDLVRHLRLHGISASIDEIDGRQRTIGASLDAYCDEHSPDLLVMGAYGSSRLKEFILGGATEHTLNRARVATFLCH